MKVVSLPPRLRLAAASLLLSVPLAAWQTVVSARAPWWKLPYASIGLWSGVVAAICLPVVYWIWRGRRRALGGIAAFGGLWCILSAWVTVRTGAPGLGFFTLFLCAYWLSVGFWIHLEMGQTFFDPGLRWYESLPKPLPGLRCELKQDTFASEFRVSRLDSSGVFLFAQAESCTGLRPGKTAELVLHYRDRQVTCTGFPIRILDQNAGAGIRFSGMTADARKSLGDFVEILRGEGHA